jgi:hypothetical protein
MPATPLPLLLPAVDLSPVEAAYEASGQALEQTLLPLFVYCEKTQGNPELTEGQYQHLVKIRAALDAVAAFGTQVEQLLRAQQANVEALNRQLHYVCSNKPQTLEKAMQVDWESIALNLLDRLRDPGATPLSPLVVRLRSLPAFEDSLARLSCSLEVRQQLASITSHHLPPPTPTAHAA